MQNQREIDKLQKGKSPFNVYFHLLQHALRLEEHYHAFFHMELKREVQISFTWSPPGDSSAV